MTEKKAYNLFDLLLNFESKKRKIQKNYDVAKNVDSAICAECGGACCKTCGCQFSPDDFKEVTFTFLKAEIEKGYISIDYVDREIIYSDCGYYILRMRNQNAPIVDCGGRRTPCILLKEDGCKLSYEKRPTGGKLLIPSRVIDEFGIRNCESTYSIKDCCYEWKEHQTVLRELVKYFRNKEIPCSL